MEKDNMQEQEDDGNSEKESKGNAKHQQHCKSYENAFRGRIRDSTQPEKAAVSWNTGQQTLCKLKCKEKKERNKQYPKTVGTLSFLGSVVNFGKFLAIIISNVFSASFFSSDIPVMCMCYTF